jgi:hypothetical protein
MQERLKRWKNSRRITKVKWLKNYLIPNTYTVKEYEIKVKSNGDGVYDGNNKCKFRVDNILKVSSTLINKLKYGLAQDSLFNLQIRYLSWN